jgi:protocatechuate 4,5-dioxygenase alpha chain
MTSNRSDSIREEITRRIAYDKLTARSIEGTYLFDGARARMNSALNRMCMSLVRASNRAAFVADEMAYGRSYGLSEESLRLVASRDWIGMIRAGGNIYYIFKLAAIDHVSMQQVGAQQNSMTLEQFRAKLNSVRETDRG